MPEVLKPIAVVQLTNAFQTIYTVPAGTQFVCAVTHLDNTTAADRVLRICLVPPAGSPLDSNALLWDFTLKAHDALEMLKGDVWDAGYSLQALVDVSLAATLKLSGIEKS